MEKTTTELYLVRHGQTLWNREKRMQGHLDSPLTEKGIMQASKLSERINDIAFDKIFASPSNRAYRTAEILKMDRPLDIIKRDELREINLGDWEGKKISEISESEPERHLNFWERPHLYTSDTGESFFDIKARVIPFVEKIVSENRGKRILIVSHTTIIKTILSYFEKRPVEKLWHKPAIFPASLSIINVTGDSCEIELYGDITHYGEHISTEQLY